MNKINLLNYDQRGLELFFKELGESPYRAKQVLQWIHQQGVTDVMHMTNLSQSLRIKLSEITENSLPEIITRQHSQDGTLKWLLKVAGGNAIEMVFIPEINRGTLCISSQVGCALNCSFCSTAKEGFNRNLTTSEIIGQLWLAQRELAVLPNPPRITNVVMMGMGEPLLNYLSVLPALNLMINDLSYGLSKYRVTVSTAGMVPMMQRLREDTSVSLAVSLHAANDELRNKLVPLNKKYPLSELIPACKDFYSRASKRVVTFEYVMLANINDSLKHAKELARLLANVPCKMNLIPFNPFPNTQYESSKFDDIMVFQNYLLAANIPTWVRKTRGQDIAAACGQLAGEMTDRTGRHERWLRTGSVIPATPSMPEILTTD